MLTSAPGVCSQRADATAVAMPSPHPMSTASKRSPATTAAMPASIAACSRARSTPELSGVAGSS